MNHNQQELQNAITQQEKRMQALADQQTMNMQQVNNTVTEMQNQIGQPDTTIATLNATMTSQFQQIVNLLSAQTDTQLAASTAPQPVVRYT